MQEKFRLGKYWIGTVPGSARLYAFHYDAGAGEVRRRSLKTESLEAAKIELAAIVLKEGEADAREPDRVRLVSVFERYWTQHSDQRHNPSAARRAGTLLLDFIGYDAMAGEVEGRQEDFIRHLHGLGLSVAYISRVQSIMQAAFNRATKKKSGRMLTFAPEIIVKPQEIADMLDAPEPEPNNWHPTLKQIANHMDAATTTAVLRCALLTLVFAGRPVAIRESATAQYDALKGLMAWNRAGRRQTKKFRPLVPVPDSLLLPMFVWSQEGERFVAGSPRRAWGETCKITGLSFPPQALRHFMATEMRVRGVPYEQRELWMGHRRHSTNDRYGQFAPEHLKAARECAEAVLLELEAMCKLSPYRQVSAKPERRSDFGKARIPLQRFDPIGKTMVGATGIEPVTPAMSTQLKGPKVA